MRFDIGAAFQHVAKTTMLNALAGSISTHQRTITAEEVFQLHLANRDVVAMQCRQPSLEGTGEIALRRLVKEALRMRPDRIVVGEVRGAESRDLLIALYSGVPVDYEGHSVRIAVRACRRRLEWTPTAPATRTPREERS